MRNATHRYGRRGQAVTGPHNGLLLDGEQPLGEQHSPEAPSSGGVGGFAHSSPQSVTSTHSLAHALSRGGGGDMQFCDSYDAPGLGADHDSAVVGDLVAPAFVSWALSDVDVHMTSASPCADYAARSLNDAVMVEPSPVSSSSSSSSVLSVFSSSSTTASSSSTSSSFYFSKSLLPKLEATPEEDDFEDNRETQPACASAVANEEGPIKKRRGAQPRVAFP